MGKSELRCIDCGSIISMCRPLEHPTGRVETKLTRYVVTPRPNQTFGEHLATILEPRLRKPTFKHTAANSLKEPATVRTWWINARIAGFNMMFSFSDFVVG
jgi:hypothetical protein